MTKTYLELDSADYGYILSFDPELKDNWDVLVLADFIDFVIDILDNAPHHERKDFK